jgi:hypothetical protein
MLTLTACAPRAELTLTESGGVRLLLQSSTSPDTAKLLGALSSLWGGTALFSEPALAYALGEAGFDQVQVRVPDGFTFDTQVAASNGSVLFADSEIWGPAITYRPRRTGTGGLLRLTISPESVEYLLALLPDESAAYADLLLAPLFEPPLEGEESPGTPGAYIDLIAAVYGREMAASLPRSSVTLEFTAPSDLRSHAEPPRVHTVVQGRRGVRWTIPLAALLSLSTAAEWQIEW